MEHLADNGHGQPTTVSGSIARAFPARLAPVIMGVEASLPRTRLRPAGSVIASNSRAWPGLVVTGEPVLIPKRVYNPEPAPGFTDGLGDVETAVAASIYSRHHDGHVRQRWLSMLLSAGQPWTAPFIVQLLGEYVIEICRDIHQFSQQDHPAASAMRENVRGFMNDNRCFAALTRQRAISYWSCYYRGLHVSQDTYPALTALALLDGNETA